MGNKASLMLQDDEIRQIAEETGFSGQQIEKLYSRFTHLDRTNCGALSKDDLLSIPELAINPLCDRLIEMFFGGNRGQGEGQEEDEDEEDRINFRVFMRVLAAFRTNNHNPHAHNHNHSHQGSTTSQLANETTIMHSGNSSSRPTLAGGSTANVTTNLRASGPGDKDQRSFNNYKKNHHKLRSDTRHLNKPSDRLAVNSRSDDSVPAVESFNDSLRDKLYFLFLIYDADNDERISFNDLKSILKMMVGNYIEDVQLDKIATRAFVEVDRDNDGFVEFGEFCRVFAGKDMDDKLRVRFF